MLSLMASARLLRFRWRHRLAGAYQNGSKCAANGGETKIIEEAKMMAISTDIGE